MRKRGESEFYLFFFSGLYYSFCVRIKNQNTKIKYVYQFETTVKWTNERKRNEAIVRNGKEEKKTGKKNEKNKPELNVCYVLMWAKNNNHTNEMKSIEWMLFQL